MTHERCLERLSEHLDGELDAAERREVDLHLAGCTECSGVMSELRALTARASSLEDRPPSRDLWPGVAAAIGAPRPRRSRRRPLAGSPAPAPAARRQRRVSLPLSGLAAAGLALALASGSAAWWLRPLAVEPPPAPTAAPSPAEGVPAGLEPLDGSWSDEIGRLEAALAEADGLRAATVRVLERNLAVIDRAIRESREALAADPGNPFLQEHLRRAYERKLGTLREAAALASGARS